MSGLQEIPNISQPPGEPPRQWFVSDDLELVVWFDRAGRPNGFQLCYDKGRSAHAVTWQAKSGYSHLAVDDGDRASGKYKALPILKPAGPFPAKRVIQLFAEGSGQLPRELADFVRARLEQHPDYLRLA